MYRIRSGILQRINNEFNKKKKYKNKSFKIRPKYRQEQHSGKKLSSSS